ncbi:hypothetical protein [Streptomyces tibetensis]|uniref:hypothetical protein n=1 Tax=Streptomyces tibetensis TaxID=2382123 RepID=UPI0033C636D0
MAPQPVPAFEVAASTVRVPATLSTALRHATAGLQQRLAVGGRRSGASAASGTSADLAATTALPGAGGLTAAPALAGTDALTALTALTGLVGTDAVAALTGLVGTDAVAALTGLVSAETTPAGSGPPPVTGPVPIEVRLPGTPGTQGKPSRPWARLARGCLTLVRTLLPRPRPAHTTITVYIATTDGVVSERPGGSAP